MAVALIRTSPLSVISTFNDVPDKLRLPSGDVVQGAALGWKSGIFALVTVAPFVVPQGQQATGAPTYTTDGATVTETYDTRATPASSIILTATLTGRLSQAEQIAIYKAASAAMAAGNASYMFWLTTANSNGSIDLADPATIAVKAAIVAAGLLSQARADAVFSGVAT